MCNGGNDHHDKGNDDEQEPQCHDCDSDATRQRLGLEEFDYRVQSDGDEQRQAHDDQGAGDVSKAAKDEVRHADAQSAGQTDEERVSPVERPPQSTQGLIGLAELSLDRGREDEDLRVLDINVAQCRVAVRTPDGVAAVW